MSTDARAAQDAPGPNGAPNSGQALGAPLVASAIALPTGMLTFLIADVRGYTAYTHQHGDVKGAALAARFAALAGEAVTGHEGRVVEVRGDEVMAVFTSARGALRAAVELLVRCTEAATPELPLRAGVGLDVGEPVPVPGGYRGEAINVAARLCARAGPGEVLASEAVVGLARRIEGLEYEEQGPLDLKGLSRPVRAWLVRAASTVSEGAPEDAPARSATPAPLPSGGYLGAAPRNALVAREGERGRIERAIDAVAGGAGQLILLTGEPGVGKTRLAQEAMLAARERGFHLLVGRCYEQDTALPFTLFLEALTTAGALASPDLRAAIPARFADLGLVLPTLVPPPSLPEGEDPRRRVFAAVGAFLAALAAEAPVALLLDDLHWADSASLDLLGHLARALRGERVFLLGTYRDVEVDRRHPLRAVITGLTRERLLEVIKLSGLPPAGTAALIRARFSVEEVSDELVTLVHERTEGNPFFTEEVLTALVEQGNIYHEGDAWERTAVTEIELPESVKAVVGQRVERLGQEAREILRVASVLGQEWDLEVLLGAVSEDEAVVLDHLEAALNARLLEERRSGRRERYAFAHALVAQVLYDEVPRFRLRRLHRQAAEALERAHGERPEAAAELARHFLAAGDLERGLRYTLVAGDHGAGLYAQAEALLHYETALELLLERGDEQGAATVRKKLGGILVNQQRTAEAMAAYQAARAFYERTGDIAGLAEIEREIGWAYQVVLDFASAGVHLENALRLWPPEQENAGLARLLLDAARARVLVGDHEAATPLAERGMALAEKLGEETLQAQGLIERALVPLLRGSLDEGMQLLNQAESLARRSGARQTLARALLNKGEILYRLGELTEAVSVTREAAALAEALGLETWLAVLHGNLAEEYLQLGDWERGRLATRALLAIDPSDRNGYRSLLAWMEGDPARTLSVARKAIQETQRRHDVEGEADLLLWLAGWQLELGEVEKAMAAAHAAIAPARAMGKAAVAVGVLAEAAVLQDAPDAVERVAEARAMMEQEHLFRVRPHLLRTEGLLLWRQGDLAGAPRVLRESAVAAREQDALPILGRILTTLAEVARAAGDGALATEADSERATVVARIGPEARGLPWARGP